MEKYRIEEIEKVRWNGRKVKIFKAFEYDKNAGAYIFCGQFVAPVRTKNDDLENYIN